MLESRYVKPTRKLSKGPMAVYSITSHTCGKAQDEFGTKTNQTKFDSREYDSPLRARCPSGDGAARLDALMRSSL